LDSLGLGAKPLVIANHSRKQQARAMRFLIIILLSLLPATSFAQTRIIDGDTIEIGETVYRLNGIDAPEAGQKCKKGGKAWACGKAAIEKLASLVEGKAVSCDAHSQDGYGRSIATCYVNGEDLGAEMVRTGFAWAFVKYSTVYVQEEEQAQARGIGIWQGDAQPAWEYRAARWKVATQEAPDGCPIKGNISRNGRIYHPPWSPWYSRTKITLSKGERWFCSEAEAVAAGWRAPQWR
jgi:endonuclease YncB( thermonuclease family)